MDTLNQSVSMVMSQTRGQTRNNSPSRYPKMTSGLGYLYVQLIWKTMLWTKYRRNWETFPSKVWKYLAITLLGTNNIPRIFRLMIPSTWNVHQFFEHLRMPNRPSHGGGSSLRKVKCWNPRRLGLDDFVSSLMFFFFFLEKKCFFGTLE